MNEYDKMKERENVHDADFTNTTAVVYTLSKVVFYWYSQWLAADVCFSG